MWSWAYKLKGNLQDFILNLEVIYGKQKIGFKNKWW